MKSKIIGAVLALSILGVPLGIKLSQARALEPVEVEAVSMRQIRPTILASGVLVFQQEIHLSTELMGPVAEVFVKEGARVRKGDPLLRLDQRLYAAELEQQRSAMRSAGIAIERTRLQLASQRLNLNRNEQLVAANFIAASKYDEAANLVSLAEVELQASTEQLRQAAAQYELSRERLGKTTVRAPIDGTVTALNIKVGETAVPNATGIQGSALLTIADDASMLVEVNVDEADIASVAVGQRAAVFPSAAGESALDGEIQGIALSPRIGAQGRSYIVKVRLEGRHPDLRTGMTARVEIAGGRGVARPAVSLRAVLADAQRSTAKDGAPSYVIKVAGGVARKVKVDLGLSDNSHQEVLNGLADGELVVVGPARTLRELQDGQGIKPQAPTAPPKAVATGAAAGPKS